MSTQPPTDNGFIILEGNLDLLPVILDKVRRGEPLTLGLPELDDYDSMLLLDEEGLPTIHFKAPMKPKAFLHAPVIRVDLQHYTYLKEGHIVRMNVIVYDDVNRPYGFEIFLNPAVPECRPTLEALASCPSIRLVLYPMNHKVFPNTASRAIKVTEEQRSHAHHISEVTLGCHTLWPAAIHRCASEIPLFG